MFTYKLTDKAIENGKVRVSVEYTDGTIAFSETCLIASKEDLDRRITAKLAELEATVLLSDSLIIENYVKAVVIIPVHIPTALEIALEKLRDFKILRGLGAMEVTEKEFIDAVIAYKEAKK